MKKLEIENKHLSENNKIDLRKHVRLIIKSFQYIRDLITSSKKLAFYIVKLIELTRFLIKRYHEIIFQLY